MNSAAILRASRKTRLVSKTVKLTVNSYALVLQIVSFRQVRVRENFPSYAQHIKFPLRESCKISRDFSDYIQKRQHDFLADITFSYLLCI